MGEAESGSLKQQGFSTVAASHGWNWPQMPSTGQIQSVTNPELPAWAPPGQSQVCLRGFASAGLPWDVLSVRVKASLLIIHLSRSPLSPFRREPSPRSAAASQAASLGTLMAMLVPRPYLVPYLLL